MVTSVLLKESLYFFMIVFFCFRVFLQKKHWGRVVIVLLFAVAIIVNVALHAIGIGTIPAFVSNFIFQVTEFLGGLLCEWIVGQGGLVSLSYLCSCCLNGQGKSEKCGYLGGCWRLLTSLQSLDIN